MTSPLMLRALQGEKTSQIPFWFMRQAGRYLPEYQAIRKDFSNFLEFCYTPEAACEVTLQPIRRFGMDAAILFSDILVIPDSLGQKVSFVKGEGPKLEALEDAKSIQQLSLANSINHLKPVSETVRRVKAALPEDKILIGFSGAPWTLACYMIEGHGSRDFAKARAFILQHPEAFSKLIDMLVQAITDYCIAQIEAGADAIQLFDSWAGVAPASQFNLLITQPAVRIIAAIKARYPDVPIIAFAKGAGVMLSDYAKSSGADALGIDQHVPMNYAKQHCAGKVLQGNLDNVTLASSKSEAVQATKDILAQMRDAPLVFNLGHGILPHTPIAHVEAVVETIRSFSR